MQKDEMRETSIVCGGEDKEVFKGSGDSRQGDTIRVSNYQWHLAWQRRRRVEVRAGGGLVWRQRLGRKPEAEQD